jgi:hypothetical protein
MHYESAHRQPDHPTASKSITESFHEDAALIALHHAVPEFSTI